MKRRISILFLFIATIITFPLSAKLNIAVYSGCNIVSDSYAMNKMDYALFAANGREWFIDNVLFHDYGKIYIFFAPGDFVAFASPRYRFSSKQDLTEEYIIGLKNAIDYLAARNDTLYIKNSVLMGHSSQGECRIDSIYCYNFWYFFLYPEWKGKALFGKLNKKNSHKMVSMLYNNSLTINAFGRSYQDGNFIHEYEDRCRKKGLKPITPPSEAYQRRPQYFSDADIDFFLECRFGDLDFHKRHTRPRQDFIHVFDYKTAKSNNRSFQYFKTIELAQGYSRVALRNNSLKLALYPSEFGPLGHIRSVSLISKALYEANGREWFVENILFCPRKMSSFYFPMDGLSCYRTECILNNEFAEGIAKAIDNLSVKKATLCVPIKGWRAPYIHNDKVVDEWIERIREHYTLDDTWISEIRTCNRDFQYGQFEERTFEPFAFENMKIWPHLDNGTEEGRIFRSEYEKDCNARNLRIIGDHDIGPRSDYSDEDIDLFVDWIMKANDYYISQPAPAVLRPLNVRYWVTQMDERKLTIRETCRQ